MESDRKIDIFMAPLQGFTEVEYRRAYVDVYGTDAVDMCFTPFIRIEHGEPRPKDLRDALSGLNTGVPFTVPQIICNGPEELVMLRDMLVANGITRIDINAGCPHKPQVNRGRGSGLLSDRQRFGRVMEAVALDTQCRYSLKMRLGTTGPDEWRDLVDVINDTPLEFVTVHPRTGSQQYSGTVDMDRFAEICGMLRHKVVYNGDLLAPDDIDRVVALQCRPAGVMIGRGLLARPSLPLEWRDGESWSRDKRMARIMALYQRFEALITPRLCGDSQILSKLRPFWQYLEPEIGRKASKMISKAGNMEAYRKALRYVDM